MMHCGTVLTHLIPSPHKVYGTSQGHWIGPIQSYRAKINILFVLVSLRGIQKKKILADSPSRSPQLLFISQVLPETISCIKETTDAPKMVTRPGGDQCPLSQQPNQPWEVRANYCDIVIITTVLCTCDILD